MKTITLIVLLAIVAHAAPAQDLSLRQGVRMPDDLVSIRQLADRGSIQAQLALAKKLMVNGRYADALAWYRKTAEQECLDGIYQVGHLLMHGAASHLADQKIAPRPFEGIQWTFRAATNHHVDACRNMSLALQRGFGVQTNHSEAYAWMQLFAETDPGRGRAALEKLGLRLNTAVLVEGRRLAGEFKKQKWPKLIAPTVETVALEKVIVPLKLTGVTVGGRSPLAVINRRTFGPGETAKVTLDLGRTISLKCMEIRDDSVLVEVEGEDEPRWLQFDNNPTALAGQ